MKIIEQGIDMKKYVKPQIEIVESEFILMSGSGPGADDIGSPSVRNDSKSIWDEEEEIGGDLLWK